MCRVKIVKMMKTFSAITLYPQFVSQSVFCHFGQEVPCVLTSFCFPESLISMLSVEKKVGCVCEKT